MRVHTHARASRKLHAHIYCAVTGVMQVAETISHNNCQPIIYRVLRELAEQPWSQVQQHEQVAPLLELLPL